MNAKNIETFYKIYRSILLFCLLVKQERVLQAVKFFFSFCFSDKKHWFHYPLTMKTIFLKLVYFLSVWRLNYTWSYGQVTFVKIFHSFVVIVFDYLASYNILDVHTFFDHLAFETGWTHKAHLVVSYLYSALRLLETAILSCEGPVLKFCRSIYNCWVFVKWMFNWLRWKKKIYIMFLLRYRLWWCHLMHWVFQIFVFLEFLSFISGFLVLEALQLLYACCSQYKIDERQQHF